jgi:uncharacterized protein YaeQ
MALTATIYRWMIDLSDVDRGVYEKLELRAAMHPSETPLHLVTRVIAYALCFEDSIAFSPTGVAGSDDPAVMVRALTGELLHAIEIGTPSADRVHRLSKACARVSIFTHHDPALLIKELQSKKVHKLDTVEAWAVSRPLVEQLSRKLDRTVHWTLVRSGGELYVTVGEQTLSGEVAQLTLIASDR